MSLSPWQAKEGLVSRVLFLPPNPVSGKGTEAVHCRRALVSAKLHKRLLGACKNSLDGSSCFIRMAQHWLLLPSFVFPVWYLFAASIYLQWYLLLNLQCWVLGLSLLPEMWSSLKCPWVLVSVLFLSGSPGLLLLAMVIQEGIPGVLCRDHFLLNWKIIQTTQKFHKNMLISYGEFL